jgi:mono/diheme cytochrome c family protein
MKKYYLIITLITGVSIFTACNSGEVRRNPGKTYAPDMTYSQAYDAYTSNPVTPDGLTSQAPVKGTIARGHELPDNLSESDTTAYYALKSPFKFTPEEIDEGQRLYNIYCGVCHGAEIDGNGPLYTNGKFAAMPANIKSEVNINMSEGQMYYAIVHGKNMMGSYASQLDKKQRWQVIAFIKKIQSENGGAPFTMGTDALAQEKSKETAKTAEIEETP